MAKLTILSELGAGELDTALDFATSSSSEKKKAVKDAALNLAVDAGIVAAASAVPVFGTIGGLAAVGAKYLIAAVEDAFTTTPDERESIRFQDDRARAGYFVYGGKWWNDKFQGIFVTAKYIDWENPKEAKKAASILYKAFLDGKLAFAIHTKPGKKVTYRWYRKGKIVDQHGGVGFDKYGTDPNRKVLKLSSLRYSKHIVKVFKEFQEKIDKELQASIAKQKEAERLKALKKKEAAAKAIQAKISGIDFKSINANLAKLNAPKPKQKAKPVAKKANVKKATVKKDIAKKPVIFKFSLDKYLDKDPYLTLREEYA